MDAVHPSKHWHSKAALHIDTEVEDGAVLGELKNILFLEDQRRPHHQTLAAWSKVATLEKTDLNRENKRRGSSGIITTSVKKRPTPTPPKVTSSTSEDDSIKVSKEAL
eukprot:g40938.t1